MTEPTYEQIKSKVTELINAQDWPGYTAYVTSLAGDNAFSDHSFPVKPAAVLRSNLAAYEKFGVDIAATLASEIIRRRYARADRHEERSEGD